MGLRPKHQAWSPSQLAHFQPLYHVLEEGSHETLRAALQSTEDHLVTEWSAFVVDQWCVDLLDEPEVHRGKVG